MTPEQAADKIYAVTGVILGTDAARHIASYLSVMETRIAELEALLLEGRNDLVAWIDHEHPHREKYPHIMRDFENDMEIVRRIDAALERKKDE